MEGIQDEKVSNPQYDSNVKPDLDLLLGNWNWEAKRFFTEQCFNRRQRLNTSLYEFDDYRGRLRQIMVPFMLGMRANLSLYGDQCRQLLAS